jgi:hypothetical protein
MIKQIIPVLLLVCLIMIPSAFAQLIQIQRLQILNSNMFMDNNKVFPELHIIGEVLNSSTQPARHVEVSATLYDSNKNVIGTGNTFTAPSDIQPDHKSHFEIVINIRSIKGGDFSLVKNYAVQASGL